MTQSPPSGATVIKAALKTLPGAPGVYRMIDAAGDVIYVGKARDLKKRVAAYAKPQGHGHRIQQMIDATTALEVVRTASETEALLLEANLIKRFRPRFNVLMRDDKSFAYILITGDHKFPQIVKHRGARKRRGDYYGPFASAGAVGHTLNTLQRAFLLRSCSDSVFASRTRPCLLHQIKRCAAPCVGRISAEDYAGLTRQAQNFLSGKSRTVTAALAQAMEQAAAARDFEQAAFLRDRIRALSHVQQSQGINAASIGDADVFAIAGARGQSCVQVFFFRGGQNWGNHAYFPRHDREAELETILDSFLAQFYEGRDAPPVVLLSHKIPGQTLLGEALSMSQGRKVAIQIPQRGERREIMRQAEVNAAEALERRQTESAAEAALLTDVAAVFGLDAPPQRIEVYDNSHIQGAKPVGAMIVAGPRGFEKGQYRRFNLQNATGGDDIAMMREMLSRRFARLATAQQETETSDTESPPNFEKSTETAELDEVPLAPDLALIDGGPTQLAAALEAVKASGVEGVTVASISKGPDRHAGRENFHLPGRAAFMLEPGSRALFYLQRLRDEAHRFAIGGHRARRTRAIAANPLDAIEGIGAKRKRALLNHFGSARAVRNASQADLASVEGVSEALAQRIFDAFHSSS